MVATFLYTTSFDQPLLTDSWDANSVTSMLDMFAGSASNFFHNSNEPIEPIFDWANWKYQNWLSSTLPPLGLGMWMTSAHGVLESYLSVGGVESYT